MTNEGNLNLNWRLCGVKEPPPWIEGGRFYFLGNVHYACPNRFPDR